MLLLEELERLSPQCQVFLKVALASENLPPRAVVIATSNDTALIDERSWSGSAGRCGSTRGNRSPMPERSDWRRYGAGSRRGALAEECQLLGLASWTTTPSRSASACGPRSMRSSKPLLDLPEPAGVAHANCRNPQPKAKRKANRPLAGQRPLFDECTPEFAIHVRQGIHPRGSVHRQSRRANRPQSKRSEQTSCRQSQRLSVNR